MFQISKKSEYGLRAMVFLAKNYKASMHSPAKRKFFSVKFISEKEDISFDFLEKIIHKLADLKLVKSTKGMLGGYALACSPKKISVSNIIFNLEENKRLIECSMCKRASKCSAKNVSLKIEKAIKKTLKNIKLSDLL
jgi:Rrf2 family protein